MILLKWHYQLFVKKVLKGGFHKIGCSEFCDKLWSGGRGVKHSHDVTIIFLKSIDKDCACYFRRTLHFNCLSNWMRHKTWIPFTMTLPGLARDPTQGKRVPVTYDLPPADKDLSSNIFSLTSQGGVLHPLRLIFLVQCWLLGHQILVCQLLYWWSRGEYFWNRWGWWITMFL